MRTLDEIVATERGHARHLSFAPAIAALDAYTRRKSQNLDSIYHEDPVDFAEQFLGEDLWDTQRDMLRSVVANTWTSVKACHSSSKTRTAAYLVLWWLTRYQKEAMVVTTAPGQRQVKGLLWREISWLVKNRCRGLIPEPVGANLQISEKRFAMGFTARIDSTDEAVRWQGPHSENTLIIIDEAPGVPGQAYAALKGIMASGHCRVLELGNPTVPTGNFYESHTAKRDLRNPITISVFDTPNLRDLGIPARARSDEELKPLLELSDDQLDDNARPYLATRRWVRDCWRDWGPSPLWDGRVLGEFPQQSTHALIHLAWINQAIARDPIVKPTVIHCGLDVAGPGEDETVLIARRSGHVISGNSWHVEEPTGEIKSALQHLHREHGCGLVVNVDCVGIGYHMALRLAEWAAEFNRNHTAEKHIRIVPVNVAEAAVDSEQFANAKAEYYWSLRLMFHDGDISGLGNCHEKLQGQLATLQYQHTTKGGKIAIESKREMVKRGLKSPDWAEALMLAFKPDLTGQQGGVVEYEERYEISPF